MRRPTYGATLVALAFGASLACGSGPGTIDADAARGTGRPSDTGAVYLPGLVSTPDHDEGGLHLTAFGETYFWRRCPEEKQQIYVMTSRSSDEAGAGRVEAPASIDGPRVVPFSTDRDENPYLTRDGLTLYFGSERPIPGRPNLGNFDMNLWVTRRDSVGAPWSDPAPLPPSFNRVQAAGEAWPTANVSGAFSLDDIAFYVSTQHPGDSATRLYVYRRDADDNLVEPRRIDGFFDDARYSVAGATLSPDGDYLFFNSYGAPGGAGGEDLYVSRRTGPGRWSRAMPLTALNTEHEEAGGYVSPDGATFFYGSARLLDRATWRHGTWSLRAVPLRTLELDGLFESHGAATTIPAR